MPCRWQLAPSWAGGGRLLCRHRRCCRAGWSGRQLGETGRPAARCLPAAVGGGGGNLAGSGSTSAARHWPFPGGGAGCTAGLTVRRTARWPGIDGSGRPYRQWQRQQRWTGRGGTAAGGHIRPRPTPPSGAVRRPPVVGPSFLSDHRTGRGTVGDGDRPVTSLPGDTQTDRH